MPPRTVRTSSLKHFFIFLFTLTILITLLAKPNYITTTSFAGTTPGSDSWTTNWPPEGGSVHCLVVDPIDSNTIYAGTLLGKVYKSTNGGLSWILSSNGLMGGVVYSLAIDPANPSILYAGTNDVYKSINGGASWNATNIGPLNPVLALAINPDTTSIVYAVNGIYHSESAYYGDVYKSSNGGGSWAVVYSALSPLSQVASLAIDPLSPTTLYAGTYDNVLKSIDGGTTWNIAGRVSYPIHIRPLTINHSTPSTIYAGVATSIHWSTNGGGSWAPLLGLGTSRVSALTIDPLTSSRIYAGFSGNGVLRSTDGGISWGQFNEGLTNTEVYALAMDSAGRRIHAGTAAGVFSFLLSPLTCEAETSPVDAVTKLIPDEQDSSPLGDRTPLILIHGNHGTTSIVSPERSYFDNLLNEFNTDSFKARYKIYRFHYLSDLYRVSDIAQSLRNRIDSLICTDPALDKPYAIIAHSLGGLVARSYMNQHSHNVGIYKGIRGGDRVLSLITLGTPHHGSPGANEQSRNELAINRRWRINLAIASVFYWQVKRLNVESSLPYYEPNRFDLLWDNYDQSVNPLNSDVNIWLAGLNSQEHYLNKIITYYGYIDLNDPIRTFTIQVAGVTDSSPGLILLTALAAKRSQKTDALLAVSNVVMDYGMGHRFSFNDGLVPVESASFTSFPVKARVTCAGFNHREIKDGPKGQLNCNNGMTIFDSLRNDLGVINATPIVPIRKNSSRHFTIWKSSH